MSVRVLAPAKINPWLAVLGQRPDGYHELDTTLLALDLCDVLEARPVDTPGVQLTLDGPFASTDVPRDSRNLAVAAAECVRIAALESGEARGSLGLELRLTKNVPSQAGLGGGSSDAAAAMLAAERALGFELDAARAGTALARLGSDCVFFREAAATGFARCTGRGERVEPWPSIGSRWSFALVVPEVRASTVAVYQRLASGLRKAAPAPNVPRDVFERSLIDARASLFNSLEAASLALLPELRAWRSLLDDVGAAHFRLCGSGSSFFGLYADASEARADLATVESTARARGLDWRGTWVVSALGSGARLQRGA